MSLQKYIGLIYLFLPAWLILYFVLPYFTSNKQLKGIPGPFVAKFSNTWIALGARKGKKFAWVHWAHEKYGAIVRVGHNHVSIAEPEGLQVVYGHGNGFLKECVSPARTYSQRLMINQPLLRGVRVWSTRCVQRERSG